LEEMYIQVVSKTSLPLNDWRGKALSKFGTLVVHPAES
jgi:hypothetical protein